MSATLVQLLGSFLLLSLLSVGGGTAVIPAMQHFAVDVYGWMTAREFLDLFALSRAAPGPGNLIVVLVGQKAAGLAGAAVTAAATYLPSSLLMHAASRVWERYESAAWRIRAERALMPVVVGLTFAAGLALLRTHPDIVFWLIAAAATLVLVLTKMQPLFIIFAAAAVGTLVLI